MAQHVPPVPAQLAYDSPTAREESTTFLQKGLKLVTGMDAQFSPTGFLTGQGQIDLMADDHQGLGSPSPRLQRSPADDGDLPGRMELDGCDAIHFRTRTVRAWPVTQRAPLTDQQRA